MSQGSVDAQTIEHTKQQIRALVQQIAQMSRSEMDPDQFYAEVLQKIVTALAAVGGAVWTITPDNRLKLDYQININRELLNTDAPEAQQHLRLLQSVIQSKEPRLAPPKSGGSEPGAPGNPTGALLVLAPMLTDDSVEGVLEVFQRPDSQPASQQGYLRFLVQMSQLVGDWLKSRKLRHYSDRQALWAQIDRFAKEAHNSLDLKDTAFTIANEGRRLIGCDRLTVTVKHGLKHKVEAISGQDTLDTRSNVVTMIRKLTDRVCAAGDSLWYHGQRQDLPPQIESALNDYIDESHTKALAIVPIRRFDDVDDPDELGQDESNSDEAKGEVIGALIVEQIDTPQSRDMIAPRVELVRHHSARALKNSLEHNNLFLMPVWKKLGQAKLLVRAKTLPKTLFFSFLTLAVLASMLIPWDFRLKTTGTLEPVERADVFVGVDGLVQERLVDHADEVEEGQVLLRLRSEGLSQQKVEVQGKLARAMVENDNLRRLQREVQTDRARRQQSGSLADINGQLAQTETDIRSYREQLDILDSQFNLLTVKSPLSGEVITWEVKRMLPEGRPLMAGQRVLQVADTRPEAEWELITFLPEKDLGHFLRQHFPESATPGAEPPDQQDMREKGIDVDYRLLNQPQQTLKGKLVEVQRSAELLEEQGVCYRLRIKLEEKPDKPRTGAEVIARVECGNRPLGYVLFHDAWEWVQMNLFF